VPQKELLKIKTLSISGFGHVNRGWDGQLLRFFYLIMFMASILDADDYCTPFQGESGE